MRSGVDHAKFAFEHGDACPILDLQGCLGLLRTLFQILYHGILWGPVWDAFGAEAHATWCRGKGILRCFRLQHAVYSWLKLIKGPETISGFRCATCQATKGAG